MSGKSQPDSANNYIDINQLRSEHPVSPEQLFRYYGITPPPMSVNNRETRMACPFAHCGKQGPTGNKAISIQRDARGFLYRCFHYGCDKGGTDVSFADLLRDGGGDGKPRGERFRGILRDYVEMAGGAAERPRLESPPVPSSTPALPPRANVPLRESDNEKARQLVALPDKFKTNVATMPPAAASYIRNRPHWFGDPEAVLREWGVGYLPMDAGGDHAGGTMRGKFVFPIRSLEGEILAFAGRDPSFEEKHARWLALPESKRPGEPEPMKWRFPKAENFRRGLELWGQERIPCRGSKKKLKSQGGLVVVEGTGDVIRLAKAGILAVGIMSNQPTVEQTKKLAELSWEFADGRVQLMFDLDEEGRRGMWKLLQSLSPEAYVRVAWTSHAAEGRFAGMQPEQLDEKHLGSIFGVPSPKEELSSQSLT